MDFQAQKNAHFCIKVGILRIKVMEIEEMEIPIGINTAKNTDG